MEKKIIEVDGELIVPFDWKDKTPGGGNLGRAEFTVCMKFKGRKVSEFWVDPVQSRLGVIWHFVGGDIDFSISAYEGLKSEGAWLAFRCQEHKSTSLRIYAPTEAKFLEINYHGLSFWRSDFTKPNKA